MGVDWPACTSGKATVIGFEFFLYLSSTVDGDVNKEVNKSLKTSEGFPF